MAKPLVVITGASAGIGEATARLFSEAGHSLLLLARRTDRLEALGLPDCLTAGVDVTDLDGFRQAVAAAEGRFGPADCLVNNAGILSLGKGATQDPEQWQRMLDVNVMGVLNGIHLVLKGMQARGRGTIINISSVAGRKCYPNHAVYCGTKFAVHAITETLREEVAGSDVRFIVISPGAAETEILAATEAGDVRDGYERWRDTLEGGFTAQDIARSILFAYQQPQSVCIREIVLAATRQAP